ncbi:amino acid adenylation domain-containing protein [Longispora sp. NPDC051575]|uniref:amino acid adenylation domain-containing protein n=1 Tax=Longispora sp. NPDC051575 TaxID=3154943 RepID=UPI0034186506
MSLLLHELVAEQAARTPDGVAVIDEHRTVAYRELDRRANRLAHHLHGLGVGPESLVGVRMRRGADLVVALLAVWKAGAAYVPLDPEHPRDRLHWVLEDTAARIVLTEESLADALHGTAARPVCLTPGWGEVQALPDAPPAVDVTGDNAAYAIYTSGSTGRPKGVVVGHAAIRNRVLWAAERHQLSPADRVLQKTALTFDAACWEFFAPLISGGTVVLAPVGAERDPATMVAAIVRHGVTVLQGVPSVYRLLADEPAWRDCLSLRLLFSAGEPLHAELGRRLTDGLKAELWNTYGPTECAIDVTAHPFDPVQETGPVPIGKPLPNNRVLVLDPDGEPVPVGMPGELHAGGVGVGRGYLGRPDQTAATFVPDPYGEPGARLYRTGDQVRWRADGTLEYLGRIDQQVKINGVRIEPGELEAALAAHPEVKGAVVVAFADPEGVKRLAGYVVGTRALPGTELREFLRDRLPEALIPAVFVQLDEFPLTTSGKVDRAALPAPEPEGTDYVAPRTPAEELVARVWADLLKVDRVGVHDDFFSLGGSSLVLTRLAKALRVASGGEVQLRGLFTATTVEQQALLLTLPAEVVPPVVPVPRDGVLPLSFAQHRLWFLDRMQPASPEWVAPVLLRLDPALEPAAVRRALDGLSARHEILRTRYVTEAGEPVQVIDPPGSVELRVADAAAGDLTEVLAQQLARGFDLATGPVWRALLVRVPGEEHVLLLTLHHIASDGGSTVVIERELAALLAGTELPPLAVQYADFAAWQRSWLTDERLGRDLDYWRATLDGLRPLELPTDRPRPAERDPRGAGVRIAVPADLAAAVEKLGKQHGATPFMTLLTAFGAVLARYTGQWDTVVGVPVSGRDRPEAENLVGCFLNSLVLRADLEGATFAEALDRVRKVCTAAFAHQELPFERLVEDLQPDRDLSRTPLYQVGFDLLDEGQTANSGGEAFQDAWRISKTDVTLFMWRGEDGSLSGALEYATALFDEATMARLGDHLVGLLEAVTAAPDVPLNRVDFLDPAEKGLLAAPARSSHPVAKCVHEVFEEQVAETPDAIAVAFGEHELTYAQLNAKANRLAHHLRGLGAGPESLVGVCLERGPDLVPTLLGVLKSGAGYLPLDPVQPADRLGFMLADAGASVVVTRSEHAGLVNGTLVLLDEELEGPEHNPEPLGTPDNLIYVIYTSGSTGKPKGVCLTHENVLRLLTSAWEHYEFGPTDVWPLFHSYAFDVSVWELWGALLHGGKLVVVPREVTRAPDEFLDLLVEHQVTVLNQTPSAFRSLVALAGEGDPRIDRLNLRAVVFAGEKLDVPDLAPWTDRFSVGHPALINMYGITETTVHSTFYQVQACDLEPLAGNPVGHPLGDLRIHLLDPDGNLVPVGVPGEIYVGGPGVARGYLNRPELTAERFVPDPWGTGRLYKSGDLAKRRVDGSLEFLGRADDQVKIRGYRIELGEVQAVLAGHPSVRDAVVIADEPTPGDKRLVAYYVPTASVGGAELAEHCGVGLPEYMVPSAFVPLDKIPLTANGKLDKRALPAPDRDALRSTVEFVAPRDVVEERISEIWVELLGVEPGVHASFFALGGHSLLAVRLASRLQEEFDVEIPVRDIFERNTVAHLALLVEDRIRAEIAALSDDELPEAGR